MGEKAKIFCIGLNKTGTRSLHEAFQILGFNSVHYNCEKGSIKNIIAANYNSDRELLSGIQQYDAYSDWNNLSTNHLFKELDEQYPGSKFILNTRSLEDWLGSREKHVKRIPDLKKLQQQYPENIWYNLDKEAWKKDFLQHHKDVLDYFEQRRHDLLVFNITAGDEWKKLCTFLDVPVPARPFPFKNKAAKGTFLSRIKKRIWSYGK